MTRDEIIEKREEIMEDYNRGDTFHVEGDGFEVRIAPMGEKENNRTYIEFLTCEKVLRDTYNINSDKILTVFQTEISNSNRNHLTKKVEYAVYDESNKLLDLSVCKNRQIRIHYEIRNDSNLDMNMVKKYSREDIDILNSEHKFFNDICYPYNNGKHDIVLKDRASDIYKKYSICDKGCKYENINTRNKTISCSCYASNNTERDDDSNFSNMKDINLGFKQKSTISVIKCYKLVFKLSNKSNNIGFWIFTVIVIIHIILYIWAFVQGVSPIKNYLIKKINEYNQYITTERNKNLNNIIPPDVNGFVGPKNNNETSLDFQINNKNINQNNNNLISYYDLEEYDIEVNKNRDFWNAFYIILLLKENISNTFFYLTYIRSTPLRIVLFLFVYTADLALNTMFYFNGNISDKYHYSGNYLFWYLIGNNILICLIATVLSRIIYGLFECMIDTKRRIEYEVKIEAKKCRDNQYYIISEERINEISLSITDSLKYLKIKMIIFIIVDFLIILFFYYFIVAFCHVYHKTQVSWLIDSIVSILFGFIFDFLIVLFLTFLYDLSFRYESHSLYKIALILI